MCLLSKTNIPQVAESDITVYKLVTYKKEEPNKFYPMMYKDIVVYEIGKEAVPFTGGGNPFTQEIDEEAGTVNSYEIGEGAIHAGLRLQSLFPYLVINGKTSEYVEQKPCFAILRCVVPKGTRYFAGENGDIASEKIIPQEVMIDFGKVCLFQYQYERLYDNPILRCYITNKNGEKVYRLFGNGGFEII